jgi:hypothetical protein
MDEMWQRHKSFILQAIVGGVLFLVAFFVMRNMYGDQNDPEKVQARNAGLLSELQSKLKNGKSPSARSISEQRDIASSAEKAKWALAKRVASVAGADVKSESDRTKAYVRENIAWILESLDGIDKTQKRTLDVFVDRFDKVPQACLSSIRDAVRNVLAGKAAQTGKEIDETLGLSGYPDDEIPEAIHGLAIVTDLVSRCLAKPGIEKVLALRVSAHSSFPEQTGISFVSAIGVHMEMVGQPSDVVQVLRSMNAAEQKELRMTVIESIDYIVPLSQEEDTTKAAINVVGLRYESQKQAEGK